jgi:hypothetical protein
MGRRARCFTLLIPLTATVIVGWSIVGFETSSAAPTTISTTCERTRNGVPFLPVDRTLSVEAIAPATAVVGQPFTVTVPGSTTVLEATQQTQPVESYSMLYTQIGVSGGTVVPDSLTAASAPTHDPGDPGDPGGGPVPVDPIEAIENANTAVRTGAPGPLTPGTLTLPQWTFQVVGTSATADVVITALETGSTVVVGMNIGTIVATCPLNATSLATTDVGDPPTTTSSSTSSTSTSSSTTSTSTTSMSTTSTSTTTTTRPSQVSSTTTTTTVPPVTAVGGTGTTGGGTQSSALPRTGSEMLPLVELATALLAAGIALMVRARQLMPARRYT